MISDDKQVEICNQCARLCNECRPFCEDYEFYQNATLSDVLIPTGTLHGCRVGSCSPEDLTVYIQEWEETFPTLCASMGEYLAHCKEQVESTTNNVVPPALKGTTMLPYEDVVVKGKRLGEFNYRDLLDLWNQYANTVLEFMAKLYWHMRSRPECNDPAKLDAKIVSDRLKALVEQYRPKSATTCTVPYADHVFTCGNHTLNGKTIKQLYDELDNHGKSRLVAIWNNDSWYGSIKQRETVAKIYWFLYYTAGVGTMNLRDQAKKYGLLDAIEQYCPDIADQLTVHQSCSSCTTKDICYTDCVAPTDSTGGCPNWQAGGDCSDCGQQKCQNPGTPCSNWMPKRDTSCPPTTPPAAGNIGNIKHSSLHFRHASDSIVCRFCGTEADDFGLFPRGNTSDELDTRCPLCGSQEVEQLDVPNIATLRTEFGKWITKCTQEVLNGYTWTTDRTVDTALT